MNSQIIPGVLELWSEIQTNKQRLLLYIDSLEEKYEYPWGSRLTLSTSGWLGEGGRRGGIGIKLEEGNLAIYWGISS